MKPIEFYDLRADPDEMRDLAHEAKYRAEFDRLYAALRAWARDTEDPSIHPPTAAPL